MLWGFNRLASSAVLAGWMKRGQQVGSLLKKGIVLGDRHPGKTVLARALFTPPVMKHEMCCAAVPQRFVLMVCHRRTVKQVRRKHVAVCFRFEHASARNMLASTGP